MRRTFLFARSSSAAAVRGGYTLVEILVATGLTLLLMAGAVTLFASMSESISGGQAMIETADRLRATQQRLQLDLKYFTARMTPPLDPRDELGYFEVIEGPGPYIITQRGPQPINSENGNATDTTVGDVDDKLLFTARSYGEPFVGRWLEDTNGSGTENVTTATSQEAEIAWFMRGSTLYRRVLLVLPRRVPSALPNLGDWRAAASFYNSYDVSVRQEGGPPERRAGWGNQLGDRRLVGNSLGDLTKRENRFAHEPFTFPHRANWGQLGLPTLTECSHQNWPFPLVPDPPPIILGPNETQIDYWNAPHRSSRLDDDTGNLKAYYVYPPNPPTDPPQRYSEDVILTNVIGFDVKVWDPLAPVYNVGGVAVSPGEPGYRAALSGGGTILRRGAYVDLFYARGMGASAQQASLFSGPGLLASKLQASANGPAIYDIWSTHYENDGLNQDGDNDPGFSRPLVDEAGDEIDNDFQNGVDDDGERETTAPYPVPLRGIQVKIRVFERDSRQIREVTVKQDFLS